MRIFLLTFLLLSASGPALAQDTQTAGDPEGSSQQVEESDEAYRRRMELEDARRRDPTYTDPANSYRRDLEKIDKLPKESRENIRDQLVDIIMENPDWQPGDALEEYPYDPTAAAKADPELAQQEQEAWDEQIEKYHAREAEAFGAYRGPVQGPGNPDGAEGGQQGGESGQQGGQDGQSGQQGGQQGSASDNRNAGTYQPYQSQSSSSEDAVSTKGVSESALDFLKQRQAGGTPGQGQPQAQQSAQPGQPSSQQSPSAVSQAPSQSQDSAQADAQQRQEQTAQQEQAQQQDSESESEEQATEVDMRGIIAIEDLDKLEGAGSGRIAVPPPQEEDEDPDVP